MHRQRGDRLLQPAGRAAGLPREQQRQRAALRLGVLQLADPLLQVHSCLPYLQDSHQYALASGLYYMVQGLMVSNPWLNVQQPHIKIYVHLAAGLGSMVWYHHTLVHKA